MPVAERAAGPIPHLVAGQIIPTANYPLLDLCDDGCLYA